MVSHTKQFITSKEKVDPGSLEALFLPAPDKRHGNAEYPRKDQDVENTCLEDRDVVADPVLLVLRNALGDPGDVADFL